MELGVEGVIFGDLSVEEGGLSGLGGLLTPWSPVGFFCCGFGGGGT
jgi:hypothetical protein